MSDSIRQQIMSALEARLKTIKKASGYKTNLGWNIAHWRVPPWAEADLPACTLRDTSAENIPLALKTFKNIISVELEIACTSGSTTITDAYDLIEDVYRAIGTDQTFGGLALSAWLPSSEIVVEQEDRIIAGVRITMTIEYIAARWII